MNWAASVAHTKYSPFTRREGMPMMTPAIADTTPAQGKASQKGSCRRVMRMAAVVSADSDKGGVAEGNLAGKAG